MRFRPLGDSGLVVSVVGLGANNFGGRITDVDRTRPSSTPPSTPASTSSTPPTSTAARAAASRSSGRCSPGAASTWCWPRSSAWTWPAGTAPTGERAGSRRYVRLAVEASLRRLRTDWIDLYQYHAPDGVTPIEETLDALDELVREGKVRYVGSSNLAAWQVADAEAHAQRHGRARFVSRAEPLQPARAAAPSASSCPRASVTAWGSSPTSRSRAACSPASTGETSPHPRAPASRAASTPCGPGRSTRSTRSSAFAAERGITLLDVAIGGLAAQPAVGSVIAGATRPEQVRGERRRGRVGAVGRRPRRHRRDRAARLPGVTDTLAPDVTVERIELSEGSWVDVARGLRGRPHAGLPHAARLGPLGGQPPLALREVGRRAARSAPFFRVGTYPDPVLTDAHRWLQHRYHVQFDALALAQYRDGRDGQAFHRDRDMRHCEETVIAILTFGATRPWLLRPRARADKWLAEAGGAVVDLVPASGDLLVMGGRCQVDWEHSVPQQRRRDLPPRISAQWRWTSGRGRPEVGGSYRAARNFSR